MPRVSTYTLYATNGKKIRKATQVIYASGKVVRFMEKIPKKKALKQARKVK